MNQGPYKEVLAELDEVAKGHPDFDNPVERCQRVASSAAKLIRELAEGAVNVKSEIDHELTIAEAAAGIARPCPSIVMYGTIWNVTAHFRGAIMPCTPSIGFDDVSVIDTERLSPDTRSSAKLAVSSLDLPRDCIGHRLRVTIEVLNEIDPDYAVEPAIVTGTP